MTDDPLQRYQIMESLGAGGQANTFRGIDRETGREVAIKVLSLTRLRQWKAFDLFEREIATLERLDHPSIPRYVDNYASEKTGDFFLVMELIEGTPLSAFVGGERQLSGDELARILDQVLDVLEYLHGLRPPVVHRDIKPANIIRRTNGKIALVDFGGVRRSAVRDGGSTMVGTFGYMAPEQLHGSATPATDIYALGATMVALYTGAPADELPHDGLRLDLDVLDVPEPPRSTLAAMLEPEPNQRLQSVAQVRRALAAATTPPPKPRPKPKPSATSEQALVEIPKGARELAKVEGPLSVVVWILASLTSGLLLVVEAVGLPIAFQLLSLFHERRAGHPGALELEERFAGYRRSIRRHRNAASHIATHTRPTTDD